MRAGSYPGVEAKEVFVVLCAAGSAGGILNWPDGCNLVISEGTIFGASNEKLAVNPSTNLIEDDSKFVGDRGVVGSGRSTCSDGKASTTW